MALQWVDLNGLDVVMTYIWERLALKADKSDLTTAVRFMGSVPTYAELPTSGNRTGDMWNVEQDGSNYCWKDGGGWDDLSGIIDLSAYYTIAESEAAFLKLTGGSLSGNLSIVKNVPSIFFKNNSASVVLSNGFATYTNIAEQNVQDSVGETVAGFRVDADTGYTRYFVSLRAFIDNTAVSKRFDFVCNMDGTSCIYLPDSPASADNSKRVATTEWVNTADSVMHKTGNETVAGQKTFTGRSVFKGGRILCVNPNLPNGDAPASYQYEHGLIFQNSEMVEVGSMFHQVDKDSTVGKTVISSLSNGPNRKEARLTIYAEEDGTTYMTGPSPRATSYISSEVATTGWVDSKLAAVTATAITQEQIDDIVARLDALEAAS